jgi:hypothetical protein
MSTSMKATYGTGSLVETATGSGVWRYRWHQDGKRMRATFGTKEEPLTRKQVERAVRNREPVAPAPTATNGRTFGVVLDEWLNHGGTIRGARWAPVTESTNRGMVEIPVATWQLLTCRMLTIRGQLKDYRITPCTGSLR